MSTKRSPRSVWRRKRRNARPPSRRGRPCSASCSDSASTRSTSTAGLARVSSSPRRRRQRSPEDTTAMCATASLRIPSTSWTTSMERNTSGISECPCGWSGPHWIRLRRGLSLTNGNGRNIGRNMTWRSGCTKLGKRRRSRRSTAVTSGRRRNARPTRWTTSPWTPRSPP